MITQWNSAILGGNQWRPHAWKSCWMMKQGSQITPNIKGSSVILTAFRITATLCKLPFILQLPEIIFSKLLMKTEGTFDVVHVQNLHRPKDRQWDMAIFQDKTHGQLWLNFGLHRKIWYWVHKHPQGASESKPLESSETHQASAGRFLWVGCHCWNCWRVRDKRINHWLKRRERTSHNESLWAQFWLMQNHWFVFCPQCFKMRPPKESATTTLNVEWLKFWIYIYIYIILYYFILFYFTFIILYNIILYYTILYYVYIYIFTVYTCTYLHIFIYIYIHM